MPASFGCRRCAVRRSRAGWRRCSKGWTTALRHASWWRPRSPPSCAASCMPGACGSSTSTRSTAPSLATRSAICWGSGPRRWRAWWLPDANPPRRGEGDHPPVSGRIEEVKMTPRESLLAEAAKRILITDGAFGTEIQNWKLDEAAYAGDLGLSHDQKGNNDILAL